MIGEIRIEAFGPAGEPIPAFLTLGPERAHRGGSSQNGHHSYIFNVPPCRRSTYDQLRAAMMAGRVVWPDPSDLMQDLRRSQKKPSWTKYDWAAR